MEIQSEQTKKAIIWLCLAHFTCDIYSGFMNPIMPFIASRLGFSLGIATVLISISHICSSMLQPIFGFFADNMLKRFFIFWGIIFASVFIPLAPNSPNILFLLICMILGSLGGSFFHPQAMGFVNEFSGKNCSSNMGIFISIGSLGFGLGPIVAAFIMQVLGLKMLSWTSLLGLVLAGCMFFAVPKLSKINKPIQHKDFTESFKSILSNKQMELLILIAMMKSLVTNSSCILLPFLWKDMGYSPFYIGASLSWFVFAGAIGSFISPKIERLVGSKKIIYFSMWATLPLMFAFGLTYKSSPIISSIIFGTIGFTTMLAQPVILVLAQRTLPQYKSIVAGFINGFCWGTIALCMSILGTVAQNYGIMKVLIILCIIPAIVSYTVRYLKEEPLKD